MPFKLRLIFLILICYGFSHQSKSQSSIDTTPSISELIKISKSLVESRPDSALYYAQLALENTQSPENDSLRSVIHVSISAAYSYLADYNSSVKHSFKALEYADRFRDTLCMIDAYNNLGIDFMYQDDYESSGKYFEKVEVLSEKTDDSLRWGHALNNLGLVVGYGGGSSELELDYYNDAKEIFEAIGEQEGYANVLLNIGTVQTMQGKHDQANQNYAVALEIYKKLGYATAVEQTLQSISENYLNQGLTERALKNAREALQVAKDNHVVQDLPFIYELITKIYAAQKDFKSAFQYQSELHSVQDSIFNSEKSRQINELKTQYESEKKQQQIELLTTQYELSQLSLIKKKREQYALFLVIAFLIVFGGLFGYILIIRSKLKQRLLSQEIDNLRLKINSVVEGSAKDLNIKIREVNERLITPLSEREFEIMMLAISDQSNGEIADQLFVSVNTVKFHLKNVYEKLGVSNRKEALQFAIKTSKE